MNLTLLIPLGLLWLLSLIVLFLIYIIKPNFQQKVISSTYIWKLSLKYRKKKIPISKLRNLLLIFCQIMTLVTCSVILSEPVNALVVKESGLEAILVVDASASMRTTHDGSSRFERAVQDAYDEAGRILANDGRVSFVIADNEPYFYGEQRITAENSKTTLDSFFALSQDTALSACGYSDSDMDSAMELCSSIISVNPEATIYLYTDTEYKSLPSQVMLINECIKGDDGEFNVGIIDAYTDYVENYFVFYVDVAGYNYDIAVDVKLTISGKNGTNEKSSYTFHDLELRDDATKTILFMYTPQSSEGYDSITIDEETTKKASMSDGVYSFTSAQVTIMEDADDDMEVVDDYSLDNSFSIYGGEEQEIKVVYVCFEPNPFILGMISTLNAYYDGVYNITVKEYAEIANAPRSGYDLYIFEDTDGTSMPTDFMPSDGVILYLAPQTTPFGADFDVGSYKADAKGWYVESTMPDHALNKNITASDIYVSSYYSVSYDEDIFDCLWTVNGDPALIAANEVDYKVAAMFFSVHYSSLTLTTAFPIFMLNLFEYYFPTTISSNSFSVGETISLNCRGSSLSVKGYQFDETFTEFPASITVDFPGTYTLTQTVFNTDTITENFFVRIPAAESVTNPEADTLLNPYEATKDTDYYQDLLLYLAIVLTVFKTGEWLLQIHDNM